MPKTENTEKQKGCATGHLTKFSYRSFYDVPRMIILNFRGQKLLLDCTFDDSLDDYRPTYRVYILPSDIHETRESSWESLPAKALRCVGEIAVKDITFDRTKRSALDTSALEGLLKG